MVGWVPASCLRIAAPLRAGLPRPRQVTSAQIAAATLTSLLTQSGNYSLERSILGAE